MIGICRGDFPGQDDKDHKAWGGDDFSLCDTEHATQLRLCLPNSLKFVPCGELSEDFAQPGVSSAKAEGGKKDAGQFLRNILADHADTLPNITHLIDDSMSWLFGDKQDATPASKEQLNLATTTMFPEGQDEERGHRRKRDEDEARDDEDNEDNEDNEDYEEGEERHRGDDDEQDEDRDRKDAFPWIVSLFSICGMVLCSGLACGALCHARVANSSHARQPALLTEETLMCRPADVEAQPAMEAAIFEAE